MKIQLGCTYIANSKEKFKIRCLLESGNYMGVPAGPRYPYCFDGAQVFTKLGTCLTNFRHDLVEKVQT